MVFDIPKRLSRLETKVKTMTGIIDTLVAGEVALETVVAAVVQDNTELHALLTAALAAPQLDAAALQSVADRMAAQTARLGSLVRTIQPAPLA